MIKRVLTLAKNLNSFSIDDVLMMTGLELPDCKDILQKLIEENQLRSENDKYFFIPPSSNSSSIEIVECGGWGERKNYGINFLDAVEIFFEEHVNKFCSKSSQTDYRSKFNRTLNVYFKDFFLEDIKIEDILKFKDFCLKQCYSDGSIIRFLWTLNQLLKHFKISNYSKTLCEFKVKKISKPKGEGIVILDDETIKMIKKESKSISRTLYLVIEIILNLGLRYREIAALDKYDINFENRTIAITKTSCKGVKSEIKVIKQIRIVTFSSDFKPLLVEFFKRKKCSDHKVKILFGKLKTRLGLNNFRLDDFRHTFAYEFLKQTNSIGTLSLKLGDPNISITRNKYSSLIRQNILL